MHEDAYQCEVDIFRRVCVELNSTVLDSSNAKWSVGWDPVFRRDSSFDQILRRIAVARRDIIPATLGVSTVSSSRRASIA